MENIQVVIIATILTSALVSAFFAIYIYNKAKGIPGVRYAAMFSFAVAIYGFGYSFELASSTLSDIIFWLRIQYLGAPFIVVFALLMCLEYTGYSKKIGKTLIYSLYFIPVITIVLHYTNEYHNLFYSSMILQTNGPFTVVSTEKGLWYFIYMAYIMSCIVASLIIMSIRIKKAVWPYNRQLLFMMLGLSVPLIAMIMNQLGLSPYDIDLVPLMSSLALILYGVAFIGYRMINTTPIAKEEIFDNMRDGVLVLNQYNNLVDFNQAAKQVKPELDNKDIGKSVLDLLVDFPELIEIFKRNSFNENTENMIIDSLDKSKYYQVRISSVYDEGGELINTIIQFINQTQQILMQRELTVLATMDGLTGIYNRTHFVKKMKDVISQAQFQEKDFTVAMFDIDHFKRVNDTYGHVAGDEVIKKVVSIAKKQLTENEFMGRFGGEEFIICFQEADFVASQARVEKIRIQIADEIITFEDKRIKVTCSFGLLHVSADTLTSISIDKVLNEVDKSLYRAKNNGRNRVEWLEI